MRRRVQFVATCGIAIALALALSACALFVGSPSSLIPNPGTIVVLEPPRLLDAQITPVRTSCQTIYERVCGWTYVTEPIVQTPDAGWVYGCHDVWRGTDCWYDLVIRLTVEDPSNDLRQARSPRVRVFDADPVNSTPYGSCLLDIAQTDIPIGAADISGGGTTRTVTVRLRDVYCPFRGACQRFEARLRFALVFTADGEEMTSTNRPTATVSCPRP